MNTEKIAKAVVLNIAEYVLERLVYDEITETFVLPKGVIVSIQPELAKMAARYLGMSTKKFSFLPIKTEFKEYVIQNVIQAIQDND